MILIGEGDVTVSADMEVSSDPMDMLFPDEALSPIFVDLIPDMGQDSMGSSDTPPVLPLPPV